MRRVIIIGALAAVIALALVSPSRSIPFTGLNRGMAGKHTVAAAIYKQSGPHSNIECLVESGGPNTRLDCDDPFPNNEPDIEVNPADPRHMVVSSNDYGTCCDEFYTTFDGGRTWTTGNMSHEGNNRIGSDPVTAFDIKHDVVLHSSLNFTVTHKAGAESCDGDVVVSISRDGGVTWEPPEVVDDGEGCDLSKRQLFNDKEWIVVDNNPDSPHFGRAYVTWTKFDSRYGAYQSSAIWEAHSDDGGEHWSDPQEISGSDPALCTYQESGPAGVCDEDQGSVPVVRSDGRVFVAFVNGQNEALWESDLEFDGQYLVVSSGDGGDTWGIPRFVVGLEDGTSDYPTNVDDRQTLTGYEVRVWGLGNIDIDPKSGTLYLAFSDNRSGTHDSPHPISNTNAYLVSSGDSGRTWSAPRVVDPSPGDEWFPWVDVNPVDGTVGVLYHDRTSIGATTYRTRLAELSGGVWRRTTVSTAPSNPVTSVFFQAEADDCTACATFHGDYIGLDYGSDGRANAVWTDMRDVTEKGDPLGAGHLQFIYYARR